MRLSSLALLCGLCAIVGGAVALLVGRAAGWLGSTTIVRTSVLPAAEAPVVAARPLLGNGFQPAQIYRTRAPGVVTILSTFGDPASPAATEAQGSGFVVSRTGLVLTSAHVVTTAGTTGGSSTRATQVYVEFRDGDRAPATIVGADLFDDVAVLRVDPAGHALTPLPLGDSARVVVGQPVAAIGSPFGNADSLSVGVVSAIGRAIPSLTTRYDLVDAIQIDAPINHGNSGGPLLDDRGRVIGINAQIRSTGTAQGFEGVGFAVPIDSARRSLGQLLDHGRVDYAYIGVVAASLTPDAAVAAGYGVRSGALVQQVRSGSPAAQAGIVAGSGTKLVDGVEVRTRADVIVAIDGSPVRTSEDLVRTVTERLVPGQVARFTVVRRGARQIVSIRLGRRAGGNG